MKNNLFLVGLFCCFVGSAVSAMQTPPTTPPRGIPLDEVRGSYAPTKSRIARAATLYSFDSGRPVATRNGETDESLAKRQKRSTNGKQL